MSKEEIFEKVQEHICEYQGLEKEEVKEESYFINDLHLASIDLFQVLGEIEKLFNIEIDESRMFAFEQVHELVSYIYEKKN